VLNIPKLAFFLLLNWHPRKKPCCGVPIDKITHFSACQIFSRNWHTNENSDKNVLLIEAGVQYGKVF
jgi:hypothetical protein